VSEAADGRARVIRRVRARWKRWAFLTLPALGVLELALHLYFAGRPPSFQDWSALREPVAALRQSGELVVIAPAWAEPLARAALGDELMPMREVARPDVSRYATALEVGIVGQTSPELAGWRETRVQRVGDFVVRSLDNPTPARVVFDFTDHLEPTFADVRGTQPEVDCPWNPAARVVAGGLGGHPTFAAARFECPGNNVFFNVGVTVIADQDFRARRCIWAHPFARGELVVRFRGVPLGQVIRGHSGMYWIIERERKGAPVTIAVRVDGEEIGSATHFDGEGWAPFLLPLGAHAGAERAEVEFAVTAPNHAHRHFCFEADTR
jgi:hypothetical protein